MKYQKVTAIFNIFKLEDVEKRLQDLRVCGLSVTKVKGYGEYMDFYSHDWMTAHVRIEIFTLPEKVAAVVNAIIETAHTGISGDGMVAVSPVEQIYRIRTKVLAQDHEL